MPTLRFIDFRRVRNVEREEAMRLFKGSKGARLRETIENGPRSEDKVKKPNTDHIEKVKAAIASARTLEEVSRLENALRSGGVDEVLRRLESAS